jgi:hypothetical protein
MDRLARSSRAGPGSGASHFPFRLLVALLAAMLAACSPTVVKPPVLRIPTGTQAPPSATSRSPVTAVLVGAGDIGLCNGGSAIGSHPGSTAALLAQIQGTVFTAGDDAYENGTPAEFQHCYDPTWGAFKDRTLLPVPGNHDFNTPGGAGYFGYFGTVAGTPGDGWYGKDIGGWHIVVLNSNCSIGGCGPGSPQLTWLEADLAAHPVACTLAIWHHPRFSSGAHGDNLDVEPFWTALSAAHADLIVNGHDHDYERFGPQDPSGRLDTSDGIREIVAGTGGAELRPFDVVKSNSELRIADTYGVLELMLHATSYDWRFVAVAGATVMDSGSASCH